MGIDTGLNTSREACAQTDVDIGESPTHRRLAPPMFLLPSGHPSVERETGIEPASLAWKARVLPLNYSRIQEPSLADRSTASTLSTLSISLVEETGFEPV